MPEMIRKTAVGGLLLIGGLFIVFAVGYALEEPGGWAGAAMSAAWVVPTALLSGLAWRRPAVGAWFAIPLVAVIGVSALVLPFTADGVREAVERSGPVLPLATVAATMICAALGVHRAGQAGWLLVGLAAANVVGSSLEQLARGGGEPLPLGLLAGSGGVTVVPVLVAGCLLIVADLLERHPPASSAGHAASA